MPLVSTPVTFVEFLKLVSMSYSVIYFRRQKCCMFLFITDVYVVSGFLWYLRGCLHVLELNEFFLRSIPLRGNHLSKVSLSM